MATVLHLSSKYLCSLKVAHRLLGDSTEKGRGWEDGDDRTNSSTAPQVSAGGQNRRPWCRGPALTPSHRQEWKYYHWFFHRIHHFFVIKSSIGSWKRSNRSSQSFFYIGEIDLLMIDLYKRLMRTIRSWSTFLKDQWVQFDHSQFFLKIEDRKIERSKSQPCP